MLSSFSTKQNHAHARVFKTNHSKIARLSYRHYQAAILTPNLPGLWSCRRYLTSQELRFFTCEAGMWSTHRTLRRLISRELVFKNKLIPISYFPMFFFPRRTLTVQTYHPPAFSKQSHSSRKLVKKPINYQSHCTSSEPTNTHTHTQARTHYKQDNF